MPIKINMFIGNQNQIQISQIQQNVNNASISGYSASGLSSKSIFTSPMISRIHGIRPGCSSCGK